MKKNEFKSTKTHQQTGNIKTKKLKGKTRARTLKDQQNRNMKLCGNSYSKKYLDYIYVDELGNRIKPEYITQTYNKVLKRNNLKLIRFHDLRHSCATLLYNNGVELKDIQH